MEVTRTAKIHFRSWLTDAKKLRLTELFSASEDFMSAVLKSVELKALQGASCFDVLKKGAVARPDTELSARWQQNLIQNVYAAVKATSESAKSTGRRYKTPTISASSITLANTVTKIVTDTGLESFDLLLEINCTGMGKIAIPLKKTRVLNRYLSLPGAKLCTSITLTKEYVQLIIKFDVPKKPMKTAIGLDPGAVNLLTSDRADHYGTDINRLLYKLLNKRRNSKAWKRCKQEIKSLIGYTVNRLPWGTFDTLVLENNRNIKHKSKDRGRLSRKTRSILDGWTVGELDRRIEYATQINGVSLRRVASFYNSTTCPACGCVEKENRASQSKFICIKCGHEMHADVVGAINVLARFSLGKYGSECKADFMKQHPYYFGVDKLT